MAQDATLFTLDGENMLYGYMYYIHSPANEFKGGIGLTVSVRQPSVCMWIRVRAVAHLSLVNSSILLG